MPASRLLPSLALAVIVGLLSLVSISDAAASPYSSNVVELTARNWRTEVEESPHAVFVNICRMG
jgi:hypothetical protein